MARNHVFLVHLNHSPLIQSLNLRLGLSLWFESQKSGPGSISGPMLKWFARKGKRWQQSGISLVPLGFWIKDPSLLLCLPYQIPEKMIYLTRNSTAHQGPENNPIPFNLNVSSMSLCDVPVPFNLLSTADKINQWPWVIETNSANHRDIDLTWRRGRETATLLEYKFRV